VWVEVKTKKKTCPRCGRVFHWDPDGTTSLSNFQKRIYCSYSCIRGRVTTDAAFWMLVKKGPGCWLWMCRLNSATRHYGRFEKDGKSYLAHRYAWQLTHGINPGKRKVRHTC
jgi:ribosomal protein S27AE